jgi:hypothetical protein
MSHKRLPFRMQRAAAFNRLSISISLIIRKGVRTG